MNDANNLQSEFSLAYVRAVASASGFFIQESNRVFDADGVDVTMMNRGPLGVTRSPRLELQVKSMRGVVDGDPWPYDLGVKNYHELRDDRWQVPRILVVVCVPDDPAKWLTHTPDQLVLRRCGYWKSLRGAPDSANQAAVRIKIPCRQLFDVDNVRHLMDRVAQGEAP